MQPDDLYGLPLERFVPERGALAKELRSDGRRDEAAEVAKLRKPSAAAWAVNQLVRGRREAVADLWAAGDAVRDAQSAVLAGRGDARALRQAGARERDAVDGLVDVARGLLSAEGHELSSATLERVADTLHAAAVEETSRAAVAGGRLERELRHAGLGLGEGAEVFAAAVGAAAPAKPAGAKADAAAQRRVVKERAAAEVAEKAERVAARRQARAAAAKAAKREQRTGHALRAAEDRRARAAQALEEADAALEAARSKAGDAADEHRRARAALEEN